METKSTFTHQPVLLKEVLANLVIDHSGIYIDATFGRGGHSVEILQLIDNKGNLICIDKDPEAIQVATALQDKRIIVRQGSFKRIKEWVEELNMTGKISGILLDLGVSSPQLDNPLRGFSFLKDGPLDMRMDLTQKFTAADWINHAKEAEIAQVLYEYGEERFARRIAKAIVNERVQMPIVTTKRLAEIVSRANPKWEKHKHPATRAFQAIRILVNSELSELQDCLEQCLEVLAVKGRLLVISFHSLEDRIVKQFMHKHISGGDIPSGVPLRQDQLNIRLRSVGRAIRASVAEIHNNPRARSAVLRVMEKII